MPPPEGVLSKPEDLKLLPLLHKVAAMTIAKGSFFKGLSNRKCSTEKLLKSKAEECIHAKGEKINGNLLSLIYII